MLNKYEETEVIWGVEVIEMTLEADLAMQK
jgi:hypothetical protein